MYDLLTAVHITQGIHGIDRLCLFHSLDLPYRLQVIRCQPHRTDYLQIHQLTLVKIHVSR